MDMPRKQKIIISVVVAVLLVVVYTVFDGKSKVENVSPNTQINISTSTNNIIGSNNGYTIEQVPIDEGRGVPQPIPNLDRQVVLYTGAVIAPEAKKLAEENIKKLQGMLKTDPSNLPAWLDLGINQKSAGDYEGAAISFKYATKLSPTSQVAFGNLGNLYAYYLKDNGQAEVYYKQAISKTPTQAYLYIQLAEVYRDVFRDMDKAKEIINQGLSKIPNDPSLVQFKSYLN
ncbi:MAG: tetratricopeptide repeat protein [Parcubacteria group bacterium]